MLRPLKKKRRVVFMCLESTRLSHVELSSIMNSMCCSSSRTQWEQNFDCLLIRSRAQAACVSGASSVSKDCKSLLVTSHISQSNSYVFSSQACRAIAYAVPWRHRGARRETAFCPALNSTGVAKVKRDGISESLWNNKVMERPSTTSHLQQITVAASTVSERRSIIKSQPTCRLEENSAR
jgi:hypothetical protein